MDHMEAMRERGVEDDSKVHGKPTSVKGGDCTRQENERRAVFEQHG